MRYCEAQDITFEIGQLIQATQNAYESGAFKPMGGFIGRIENKLREQMEKNQASILE